MAAAPSAAPPRRSEARTRRGRVRTIAAVTGTRIHSEVHTHHHRGRDPAGSAAHAVRLLRGIQERGHGEGQQGVAEQNSQLACVEPVEHERVDSVEEPGTEARGERRGAHAGAPPRSWRAGRRPRPGRPSPPARAGDRGGASRSRAGLPRSGHHRGRRPPLAGAAGEGRRRSPAGAAVHRRTGNRRAPPAPRQAGAVPRLQALCVPVPRAGRLRSRQRRRTVGWKACGLAYDGAFSRAIKSHAPLRSKAPAVPANRPQLGLREGRSRRRSGVSHFHRVPGQLRKTRRALEAKQNFIRARVRTRAGQSALPTPPRSPASSWPEVPTSHRRRSAIASGERCWPHGPSRRRRPTVGDARQ